METKTNVKHIIEEAYKKLTINCSIFIDINDYKTAEIEIPELLKRGILSIGVGLCKLGGMQIFKINNEFDSDDHRRFEPIFRIAYMVYNPDSCHEYLDMRYIGKSFSFETQSFSFWKVGDFKNISIDMQSVCCIIKEIERAESEFLTKNKKIC